MRHRILYLVDYFYPHHGGAELVFSHYVKAAQEKGYEPFVVTSHFDQRLPRDEYLGGVRIIRVGKTRFSYMYKSIITAWRLHRKQKFSMIHGGTYGGAFPTMILQRLLAIPSLLTVHELFGALWIWYKGILFGSLYRLGERLFLWGSYTKIHVVSYYTYNSVRLLYGVHDSRLIMIPNAVDTDFWQSSHVTSDQIQTLRHTYALTHKKIFFMYGHPGVSKGFDTVLSLLSDLPDDWVVVWSMIDSLRKPHIYSQYQGVNNILLFDGLSQEDIRLWIASADAVIAPSLSEGYGLVHAEVSAMNAVLITTCVAAIPEVVSGKILYCEPGNKQSLLDTMKLSLEKKFDDASLAHALHTSTWKESCEKMLALYERVIRSK